MVANTQGTSASGATVAESILKRAEERRRGMSDSPLRTALVVHGGGMRSVASCGTVAALNELGLTNAFDAVFGVSSGAVNAAYFLSKQAALGVTVYLEDVNNLRFVNFFRFWKMMDLDYFFDDIVLARKKHDAERLRSHPTELRVIATDAQTADARWFSSKEENVDFYAALKASCSLPIVYPGGVKVNGRTYLDGGYWEPIPMLTAVHEGAFSHILVALTKQISEPYTGEGSLVDRFIIDPLIRRDLPDPVYSLYQTRWQRYNQAINMLHTGFFEHDAGNKTRLASIVPSAECEVSRFEKRASRLADSAFSCWARTFAFFGQERGADRKSFDHALVEAKAINTRSKAHRPVTDKSASPNLNQRTI